MCAKLSLNRTQTKGDRHKIIAKKSNFVVLLLLNYWASASQESVFCFGFGFFFSFSFCKCSLGILFSINRAFKIESQLGWCKRLVNPSCLRGKQQGSEIQVLPGIESEFKTSLSRLIRLYLKTEVRRGPAIELSGRELALHRAT